MMQLLGINTYGFLDIYDNDLGQCMLTCPGVSCSQIVRKTFKGDLLIKNGKIRFYYPTEWMLPRARNKEFLNYWLSLAGRFFCKVVHTSSEIKAADMPFRLSIAITNEGSMLSSKTQLNKGDAIFEDKWEGFEIEIKNNDHGNQIRNYLSYCMIRYLFSPYYQIIIDTFILLNTLAKFSAKMTEEAEFMNFQLAHYWFPGSVGFYSTYSIMPTLNRERPIPKPLTQKQFDERVSVERNSVHEIFQAGDTNLIIKDFQAFLEQNQISKIYEATK